jgi:hypothetical protein
LAIAAKAFWRWNNGDAQLLTQAKLVLQRFLSYPLSVKRVNNLNLFTCSCPFICQHAKIRAKKRFIVYAKREYTQAIIEEKMPKRRYNHQKALPKAVISCFKRFIKFSGVGVHDASQHWCKE